MLPNLFDHYQALDGVRLNIAVGQRGEVVGESGTSKDVSNSDDRALLRHLRSLTDVIVTTGATARAEGLKPSKYAPLVVLTRSKTLEGLDSLVTASDASRCTLLTTDENATYLLSAISEIGSAIHVAAASQLEPAEVLSWLRSKGHKRILVEFGPQLTELYSDAGLIDEICLTETGLSAHAFENQKQGDTSGAVANSVPAFVRGRFVQRFNVVDATIGTRFAILERT